MPGDEWWDCNRKAFRIERACAELKRKLQEDLIKEYPDVFSEKLPSQLKEIKPGDITHVIKLKDEQLEQPSRGYYPIPHKFYQGAKAVIDAHIEGGRLIPSNSQNAAATFFKWKKEGPSRPPRMLCDYRARNANTVRNATTPPTVDDIIRIATGTYFAKFDLTDAFCQIRMDPNSQQYTARHLSDALNGQSCHRD